MKKNEDFTVRLAVLTMILGLALGVGATFMYVNMNPPEVEYVTVWVTEYINQTIEVEVPVESEARVTLTIPLLDYMAPKYGDEWPLKVEEMRTTYSELWYLYREATGFNDSYDVVFLYEDGSTSVLEDVR